MTNRYFRERFLIPIVIPTAVLVGAGFFIVNLSRVLLAVNKDLSVVIAIAVAIVILAGAAWAATRPRIARSTLVALLVLLALAVGTSGAIAAKVGERKIEKHEAAAPGTEHSPGGPAPSAPPSQAPQAGGATVKLANFAFAPKEITIKAGTEVTWDFADGLPHTVSSAPGAPAAFESGQKTGGDFKFTFSAAGTYQYYCKLHGQPGSGMAGTVIVT